MRTQKLGFINAHARIHENLCFYYTLPTNVHQFLGGGISEVRSYAGYVWRKKLKTKSARVRAVRVFSAVTYPRLGGAMY